MVLMIGHNIRFSGEIQKLSVDYSAPDKKGGRDNLEIIFHINPSKHML